MALYESTYLPTIFDLAREFANKASEAGWAVQIDLTLGHEEMHIWRRPVTEEEK